MHAYFVLPYLSWQQRAGIKCVLISGILAKTEELFYLREEEGALCVHVVVGMQCHTWIGCSIHVHQ